MVKVYIPSLRASKPDPYGARQVVIGERETLAFEGIAAECADYLTTRVPVGQSVAVRHAGGIRSCMNKPSLWADVRGYQEGNA